LLGKRNEEGRRVLKDEFIYRVIQQFYTLVFINQKGLAEEWGYGTRGVRQTRNTWGELSNQRKTPSHVEMGR